MERFSALCAERNITLLFTSHDMDHARAFSDRIVALKDGVVRFQNKGRKGRFVAPKWVTDYAKKIPYRK